MTPVRRKKKPVHICLVVVSCVCCFLVVSSSIHEMRGGRCKKTLWLLFSLPNHTNDCNKDAASTPIMILSLSCCCCLSFPLYLCVCCCDAERDCLSIIFVPLNLDIRNFKWSNFTACNQWLLLLLLQLYSSCDQKVSTLCSGGATGVAVWTTVSACKAWKMYQTRRREKQRKEIDFERAFSGRWWWWFWCWLVVRTTKYNERKGCTHVYVKSASEANRMNRQKSLKSNLSHLFFSFSFESHSYRA